MRIFTAVLSVLFAALCGAQMYFAYGVWSVAADIAMFLALPVCVVLHELGHMLFGAIVKIKAVPHFSLLGSSCCKIIPKTDKNLKGRIVFTALGGLTVNALFIALGIVAIFVPAVPLWLCVPAPASTYLFLVNFAATEYGEGKTDALVCQELLGETDSAKVMLAVLTVQAQVLGGKPIEEVDESLLFKVPQIQEDDINFIALTELRYEYYKAKNQPETAKKYKSRLEDLKQYLPDEK